MRFGALILVLSISPNLSSAALVKLDPSTTAPGTFTLSVCRERSDVSDRAYECSITDGVGGSPQKRTTRTLVLINGGSGGAISIFTRNASDCDASYRKLRTKLGKPQFQSPPNVTFPISETVTSTFTWSIESTQTTLECATAGEGSVRLHSTSGLELSPSESSLLTTIGRSELNHELLIREASQDLVPAIESAGEQLGPNAATALLDYCLSFDINACLTEEHELRTFVAALDSGKSQSPVPSDSQGSSSTTLPTAKTSEAQPISVTPQPTLLGSPHEPISPVRPAPQPSPTASTHRVPNRCGAQAHYNQGLTVWRAGCALTVEARRLEARGKHVVILMRFTNNSPSAATISPSMFEIRNNAQFSALTMEQAISQEKRQAFWQHSGAMLAGAIGAWSAGKYPARNTTRGTFSGSAGRTEFQGWYSETTVDGRAQSERIDRITEDYRASANEISSQTSSDINAIREHYLTLHTVGPGESIERFTIVRARSRATEKEKIEVTMRLPDGLISIDL